MIHIISDKLDELQQVCRTHHVRRLEIFGSATRDDFDPDRSDLDFLVVFEDVPGIRHIDQYLGLQEDLERLFSCPVDLIELLALENPFFLRAIKPSRVVLYDAA